jgi:hypothetical protein
VIETTEYEGLRRAAAAAPPSFRAHLRAIPPTDADAEDDFPRASAATRGVDLS